MGQKDAKRCWRAQCLDGSRGATEASMSRGRVRACRGVWTCSPSHSIFERNLKKPQKNVFTFLSAAMSRKEGRGVSGSGAALCVMGVPS